MPISEPAATIILVRNNNNQREVLLLKRNKALKFASGFWVFPGGKVEPNEIAISNSDLEAAKLAAVRETQEETDLDIDIDSLHFFSHWTTPESEKRRFATWFFLADISHLDTENIKIDGSEITEHKWIELKEAMHKGEKKELLMMPPTYLSILSIYKHKTIADAITATKNKEVVHVLPRLVRKDTFFCSLYPGDVAYQSKNLDTAGARHRMKMDFVKGVFVFEYKDCELPSIV